MIRILKSKFFQTVKQPSSEPKLIPHIDSLKDEIIDIESITEQIVKHYKPEKIILFGSFARGEEKPSSDVDLLIIKKTEKNGLKGFMKFLCLCRASFSWSPWFILTAK